MARQASTNYNLQKNFPLYSKLFHSKKNKIKSNELTPKSGKIVWWKCKKGHEFQKSVCERVNAELDFCPYCTNRMANNENNLSKLFPHIAKQWHPKKNGKLKPQQVVPGISKKVWWICKYNKKHIWKAEIRNRTKGNTDCPKCYTVASELEIRFFSELEILNQNILWKVRKYGFEIDIFLEDLNLGIEIDGSYWHKNRDKFDKYKNKVLKKNGIKVIRFRDSPLKKIEKKDYIFDRKTESFLLIKEFLTHLIRNVVKDKVFAKNIKNYLKKDDFQNNEGFYKYRALLPFPHIKNSLFFKRPSLIKEWHPTKNKGLDPKKISPGSSKKIWWKCSKNHIWKAALFTRKKSNCPYCEGKLASKNYNFLVKFPNIAKEWNKKKNGNLKPHQVTPVSGKKVWWTCKKNKKHIWKTQISTRTQGRNCPFCSSTKISDEKSLLYLFPKLSKEWDFKKNKTSSPKDVFARSNKKAWWKCKKNHSWEARIYSRADGMGCPKCSGFYASKERNLKIMFPDLIEEWDFQKNKELQPENCAPYSHKRIWWKCKRKHSWSSIISSRTSEKTGCPKCSPIKNQFS